MVGCNLSPLCEVHIFPANLSHVMMLTTDHDKNDDDGFLMGFPSILQFTLFMAVVVVAPCIVPYVNMRLDMDALRGLCICSAE